MPPSAKRPHEQDQSTVKLSVKSQLSKEMFFTIKRHSPLKKLLVNYCEKTSLEYRTVHFLYDGDRFSHSKTPAQLGMEDGDTIDVMMQVDGGGCQPSAMSWDYLIQY
ncbi:hypothetical protein Ddye_019170 [Dipteronia dyeriana]|uniref:Ubiquitin-like domain-containing protein n=1 Tax=Dipteronia dyeriana TaxID=168575 RepID=A0AAD9TYA0_9ROSI|nr:hypothetical protein Ddye_019170 [Dipteronia dyeriana]